VLVGQLAYMYLSFLSVGTDYADEQNNVGRGTIDRARCADSLLKRARSIVPLHYALFYQIALSRPSGNWDFEHVDTFFIFLCQ